MIYYITDPIKSKPNLSLTVEVSRRYSLKVEFSLGNVVDHDVVSLSIRPDLVTAHPGPDLVLSLARDLDLLLQRFDPEDSLLKSSSCKTPVRVLITTVDLHLDPRGEVSHHYAAVGFVAVLSAGTRSSSSKRLNLRISNSTDLRSVSIKNGDGNCRGVNSPVAFGGRDSLPTMSTGFSQQPITVSWSKGKVDSAEA